MKNIHVIPTDKASRLMIDTIENKLYFQPILHEKTANVLTQHIYITSDEEIYGFENNIWVIKGERIFLWQNTMALVSNNKPKKIILTTDQDLIADGVQAIDDEFLEWFVKNPSCEFVEVDKPISRGIPLLGYKIIIPQKEPKQETLNKINNMNEEIKKQINLLEEEQTRVKQFINENNFNCTTAPYVIAKQYRDEIKKHIGILKMNLEN
jgi:hypothetical protein